MLNIAVIFGGKSVEHDISIITGTLTLNSLNKFKFNPIPIYIDKQGLWYTGELNNLKAFSCFNSKLYKRVTLKLGEDTLFYIKGKKIKPLYKLDCIINCTHGYNGEDGSISGLVKLCNIPFASPDTFTSSFSMDKEYTKIVLKGLGIKTINYKVLNRQDFMLDSVNCLKQLGKIDYPVIVKPARLGSSIGIAVAQNFNELLPSCEKCFKFDDKLLLEPLIQDFTEINCAVYKGEKLYLSQLEKPISKNKILSFEDKYEGQAEREFPAKLEKTLATKIKTISKKVYTHLGFNGVIRIDYIIKDDVVYLNEINTIPGSMAYYLFCDSFSQYSCMLEELINQAIIVRDKYNKNTFLLDTKVITNCGNLKK